MDEGAMQSKIHFNLKIEMFKDELIVEQQARCVMRCDAMDA